MMRGDDWHRMKRKYDERDDWHTMIRKHDDRGQWCYIRNCLGLSGLAIPLAASQCQSLLFGVGCYKSVLTSAE